MQGLIKRLKSFFDYEIVKRNKITPFIILVFLLISFGISRLTVIIFPDTSVFIKGYHIHHYFWGILLVILSGWVGLVSASTIIKRIAAGFYGIGLGMLLDEFGLLLTCGTPSKGCNYWHRTSYDTTIIATGLILTVIFFVPMWKGFKLRIAGAYKKIRKK